MKKYGFISILIFAFSCFSQSTFASAFSDVCKGKGELLSYEQITGFNVMAAPSERQAFIAINGDDTYVGKKDYSAGNPSDLQLINTLQLAFILKERVDLCIVGTNKQIYGVQLDTTN